MGSSIRKLIGMVLDGRRDDALNSRSIWLCTSCLLCTVRCPRGIRPKSVVSALKYICEKEGRSSPDQAMESLFMDQVRESGRVNELLVSISFQRFEPKAALQSMEMGLELISKGKISIGQDRIKAIAEIKRLFSELQQE
jgi:heterodisulfide reductase subunit C